MGLFSSSTREENSSSEEQSDAEENASTEEGPSAQEPSPPAEKQRAQPRQPANYIRDGTVLEGTLRTESDVQAKGILKGPLAVDGQEAVLSEDGVVEGALVAPRAIVDGSVRGELDAEERLRLGSTAHVEGRTRTDRLVVEEGARFDGACEMPAPVEVSGEPVRKDSPEDGDADHAVSQEESDTEGDPDGDEETEDDEDDGAKPEGENS